MPIPLNNTTYQNSILYCTKGLAIIYGTKGLGASSCDHQKLEGKGGPEKDLEKKKGKKAA
jgi:hypothetical protein